MKRFATFSFLVLAISFLLPAAAHAQLVYVQGPPSGRDLFIATNVQDGEVYLVSATVDGSPLYVYNSPSNPNNPSDPNLIQTSYDEDDLNLALRLYINPPPAGGTVVLTATLVGSPGTVFNNIMALRGHWVNSDNDIA